MLFTALVTYQFRIEAWTSHVLCTSQPWGINIVGRRVRRHIIWSLAVRFGQNLRFDPPYMMFVEKHRVLNSCRYYLVHREVLLASHQTGCDYVTLPGQSE